MIDQGELFNIPNPCRGICTVNNKGFCKGCLRSRQERFHWNEFSNFQKQLIVNLCERRRLKLKAGQVQHVEDALPEYIPQGDLFAADRNRMDQSLENSRTSAPEEPTPPPLDAASRTTPQQASQIGLFESQGNPDSKQDGH
tara:strand:+ start:31447 stop:31869 length:423 start_codon:yes stop_codon:yes gene_type:complete